MIIYARFLWWVFIFFLIIEINQEITLPAGIVCIGSWCQFRKKIKVGNWKGPYSFVISHFCSAFLAFWVFPFFLRFFGLFLDHPCIFSTFWTFLSSTKFIIHIYLFWKQKNMLQLRKNEYRKNNRFPFISTREFFYYNIYEILILWFVSFYFASNSLALHTFGQINRCSLNWNTLFISVEYTAHIKHLSALKLPKMTKWSTNYGTL